MTMSAFTAGQVLTASRMNELIRLPWAMSAGGGYGGAVATTFTYPTGRFSVAPIIIPINAGTTWTPLVTANTSTSFTYQNSVGGNDTVQWVAIQMTSSAAAG